MSDANRNNSSVALGIDIGGTKILMAAIDNTGRKLHSEKVKTSCDPAVIADLVDNFIKSSGLEYGQIAGMGIGIPGTVDSRTGIVIDAPALKWSNTDIRKHLCAKYSFPVYVKNDVNLSALGERSFGNCKGSDDVFYIAIGTGTGGAIIANGRLVEGHAFSAGEIAYTLSRRDMEAGLKNDAQEFGIFERKVSGTALAASAEKLGLTPAGLFCEFQKGNQAASRIIDDFMAELSVAIANVVSLLNPEVVVIGGGVSRSMDCVLDRLNCMVSELTPFEVRIVFSGLGEEAGALGAAAYVLLTGIKLADQEG